MPVYQNFISWNVAYIKATNSCDNHATQDFLNLILNELPKGFKKKRYIWNIIRGKSFYINTSRYVIENLQEAKKCESEGDHELSSAHFLKAQQMVVAILESTENTNIRKSFVRNIVKAVPVLTIDTIPYLDPDRISMILDGNPIFTDSMLKPFVDKVLELRKENKRLTELLEEL